MLREHQIQTNTTTEAGEWFIVVTCPYREQLELITEANKGKNGTLCTCGIKII